ncbi:hypothetical protein EZV62_027522 [Acer yangbiense]|uniref:ribose-5-phosphate isomerase n=1 Tax=Acer yangbiense TaxID=1000413 RepID=A0A5C7GU54_9ROSI|nr:hypothetical protein EZV62_027522 [Acer yangbiense]
MLLFSDWRRSNSSASDLLLLVETYISHLKTGGESIFFNGRRDFPLLDLKPWRGGQNHTTITRASTGNNSNLPDAAKHTVDTYIKNGMVVGLGSGQVSGMAIQYLGRQLRLGALHDIVGVPMSIDSASEAATAGIPLLDQYQDTSQVRSRGDESIIQEKVLRIITILRILSIPLNFFPFCLQSILKAANELVFMISKNQYQSVLDGSIPVLVQSLNWMEAAEQIDDLFIGDAEVWRRPSIGHADPLGGNFPLVTKEGYHVLDVIFTSPITNLAEVAECLNKVDGVVDHGVVSKFPCTVVITSESGLSIVDNLRANAAVEGI